MYANALLYQFNPWPVEILQVLSAEIFVSDGAGPNRFRGIIRILPNPWRPVMRNIAGVISPATLCNVQIIEFRRDLATTIVAVGQYQAFRVLFENRIKASLSTYSGDTRSRFPVIPVHCLLKNDRQI